MSTAVRRRPLPALIGLLALTLLTALVWWRVANRSTNAVGSPSCPATPTQTVLPAPSAVSVSVLNSTPRTGIAKAAYLALKADGFAVNIYGNDSGHPVQPGVAEIRFGPDQKAAATLLTYYFPGATLAPQAQSQPSLIVSLGLKYTAVASSAAASDAMRKAGASVAPSSSPAPLPVPTC
jgi:LytR cell envelope-related transcriptional attenuator